jgi:hypothetical protein
MLKYKPFLGKHASTKLPGSHNLRPRGKGRKLGRSREKEEGVMKERCEELRNWEIRNEE